MSDDDAMNRVKAYITEREKRQLKDSIDDNLVTSDEIWDLRMSDIRKIIDERDAAVGALEDIAEGEPEPDDCNEELWCKNRAAGVLFAIRARNNKE